MYIFHLCLINLTHPSLSTFATIAHLCSNFFTPFCYNPYKVKSVELLLPFSLETFISWVLFYRIWKCKLILWCNCWYCFWLLFTLLHYVHTFMCILNYLSCWSYFDEFGLFESCWIYKWSDRRKDSIVSFVRNYYMPSYPYPYSDQNCRHSHVSIENKNLIFLEL